MDFNKYFKKKDNSLIFIGDTLEILVPSRYGNHGYLDISNSVKTIGIFDMVINGSVNLGYMLAAVIEILPSDIQSVTIDNEKYEKLTLHKGDVFILDNTVIQDSKISYVVFYEMVFSGHYPKFLTYDSLAFLFDNMAEVTGDKFSTDHMIFEMIMAMVSRDSTNLSDQYRLTSRTKDRAIIPLRMVSHIAQSTTAKILGSYMTDGIESALVNASDAPSAVEDLLRQ